MARLAPEQWEKAKAEYEVKAISLGEVARLYGVDISAVSRRAKKEKWVKGKSQGIVEQKVKAIKELKDVESQSQDLSLTYQMTIDHVVRERLQAEGLIASLDIALAKRGLELAAKVKNVEEWEIMTKGRRNMVGMREEKASTTVNVNQQQATITALSPKDAVRDIIDQMESPAGRACEE